MDTIRRPLVGALVLSALLAIAGHASAQPIDSRTYDKIVTKTISGGQGGGQYRTSSHRFWDKWRHKDEVYARATNNLHVWLGNSGTHTIYQSKADGTATRLPASRPVKVSGYIRFIGNTVVDIPETTSIGDGGFDQSYPLGNITFFNASATVPILSIPVTFSLSLKGSASSQITSMSHTAANPLVDSDWTLSSSRVNAGLTARGSVTVLTVGVYGSVRPIEGSMGPISSVKRTNFPLQEGGESTLFESHASATATVSFFGGELGGTAFGADFPVVKWGAPISFTAQMYRPENLADWANKSALR